MRNKLIVRRYLASRRHVGRVPVQSQRWSTIATLYVNVYVHLIEEVDKYRHGRIISSLIVILLRDGVCIILFDVNVNYTCSEVVVVAVFLFCLQTDWKQLVLTQC